MGDTVAAAVDLSAVREVTAAGATAAGAVAAGATAAGATAAGWAPDPLIPGDAADVARAVELAATPVVELVGDGERPVRALDAAVLRPDDLDGPVTVGRDSVALWLGEVESPVDGSAWATAPPPTSEAQKPILRAPAPSQPR